MNMEMDVVKGNERRQGSLPGERLAAAGGKVSDPLLELGLALGELEQGSACVFGVY